MISDDDEDVCPLCCAVMDVTDKGFFPCPCEYQVCLYCYNKILESAKSECPHCRRKYDPSCVTEVRNDVVKAARADVRMKQREERKKKREQQDKKQNGTNGSYQNSAATEKLYNVRVRKRDLVYVVGLPLNLCREEVLRKPQWFGRFGKIVKIICNRKPVIQGNHRGGASQVLYSAYITYKRERDAAAAINALNGRVLEDGRELRATTGTTKYCSFFLRGTRCSNPNCLYLHSLARNEDIVNREQEMAEAALMRSHVENQGRPNPRRAPAQRSNKGSPAHSPSLGAKPPPLGRNLSAPAGHNRPPQGRGGFGNRQGQMSPPGRDPGRRQHKPGPSPGRRDHAPNMRPPYGNFTPTRQERPPQSMDLDAAGSGSSSPLMLGQHGGTAPQLEASLPPALNPSGFSGANLRKPRAPMLSNGMNGHGNLVHAQLQRSQSDPRSNGPGPSRAPLPSKSLQPDLSKGAHRTNFPSASPYESMGSPAAHGAESRIHSRPPPGFSRPVSQRQAPPEATLEEQSLTRARHNGDWKEPEPPQQEQLSHYERVARELAAAASKPEPRDVSGLGKTFENFYVPKHAYGTNVHFLKHFASKYQHYKNGMAEVDAIISCWELTGLQEMYAKPVLELQIFDLIQALPTLPPNPRPSKSRFAFAQGGSSAGAMLPNVNISFSSQNGDAN